MCPTVIVTKHFAHVQKRHLKYLKNDALNGLIFSNANLTKQELVKKLHKFNILVFFMKNSTKSRNCKVLIYNRQSYSVRLFDKTIGPNSLMDFI